jgi:hypothetical protein
MRLMKNSIVIAALLSAAACSSSHSSSSADALYCSLQISGIEQCYGYAELAPAQKTAEMAACKAESGKIVDSCPSGYVGCCTTTAAGYTLNAYYYIGTASELRSTCSGTWTGPSGGNPDAGSGNPDGGGNKPDGGGGNLDGGGVQCVGSQVICPKGCADLDNDADNCGSCGFACPAGENNMTPVCKAGECGFDCTDPSTTACTAASGITYCDNLQTSTYSCGGCNDACAAPTAPCQKASCEAGVCGGVPDTSKNGDTCTTPGSASSDDGICQAGSCLTLIAGCYPLGDGTYDFEGSTSAIASSCACSGTSLSYTVNDVPSSLDCTACYTDDSGDIECLQ